MSVIDVKPTVEVIRQMSEMLRHSALQLDSIADRTEASGNFEQVGDAISCVANLMPNLRLDLLVARPLRQFGAN